VREPDGLGIAPVIIGIIAAVASAAGSAVATRLISGPSSPSQRQIEEQMRLQQRLEIERMLEQERVQQRGTEQIVSYAPLALGAIALVMLLR
jgi:hypothetical protein